MTFLFVVYFRDNKQIRAFGLRVKKLRKEHNISQEQLAFEAGLIRSQISRIERGEINTSISNVFAIAQALKIHPKELFDFEFKIEY